VRATMPYTISFEERTSSHPKIPRHSQDLSAGHASWIGTRTAGRRYGSHGFFNCEFYVGLRPYTDKTWQQSSIHTKADLIADLGKKFAAFPGR